MMICTYLEMGFIFSANFTDIVFYGVVHWSYLSTRWAAKAPPVSGAVGDDYENNDGDSKDGGDIGNYWYECGYQWLKGIADDREC